MAKSAKTTVSIATATLTSLRQIGFDDARHGADTANRIKAALKRNPTDKTLARTLQNAFLQGVVVHKLAPDANAISETHIAKAAKVLGKPVKNRTKTETRMRNAAAKRWQRILDDAFPTRVRKVKPAAKKGADERDTSKASKSEPKSEMVPVIPVCTTVGQLADAFAFHAAECAKVIKKNSKTMGKGSTRLTTALAEFAKVIVEVQALK